MWQFFEQKKAFLDPEKKKMLQNLLAALEWRNNVSENKQTKNHLQQTPYDYWDKYKNMQNMTTYVEKPQILSVLQKKLVFSLRCHYFIHVEIDKNRF